MRHLRLALVFSLGCTAVEPDVEEEPIETEAIEEELETETGFKAMFPDAEIASMPEEAAVPPPCTWSRAYDVPFTKYVQSCVINRDGSTGPCTAVPVVEVHRITCIRACTSPFAVTCWDSTTSQHTSQPAAQYLVAQHSVSCGGSCN